MKDIFIDASIAIKFAKPPNEDYLKLIRWLQFEDKTEPQNNAFLLVSKLIVNEYFGSCKNYNEGTSITAIYDKMQKSKRVNRKERSEIESFIKKHFTPKIWKSLRCKRRDTNDPKHIALILLSDRKMALTDDTDLLYDLLNFPKFKKIIKVERNPANLDYK